MKNNQHNRREFLNTMVAGAAVAVLPTAAVAADIKPADNKTSCRDCCLNTWRIYATWNEMIPSCSRNSNGCNSNEKEFRKWVYRRGIGECKLYYLGDPVCVHQFELDLRKRKRFIRINGPSYRVDIDTSAISISETKDAFGNLKLRFMDSSIMRINAPAAAENSKS